MANMITVCYCAYSDEFGTRIVTTEKNWWDQNHRVDDGDSDYFEDIRDAMEDCGAEETGDSEFLIDDDMSVESLIADMKEYGFIMVEDTSFNAFLNRC